VIRALVDRVLRGFLVSGRLTLVWPDGRMSAYGSGAPRTTLRIGSWRLVRRLVASPVLAFGEGFVDGELVPLEGSIADALEIVLANAAEGRRHPAVAVQARLAWLRKRLRRNEAPRARRNVAHHYDLDGRLYALFLDRDLNYSCAYFATGEETLEAAQLAKQRRIAAKLLLDRPDLSVLDIGCGWGSLALRLAEEYGARVTGITLSEEQLTVARERAAARGLADRVRFELADYRSVRGCFDRVVSVGMFEHVGVPHYGAFFDSVARVLAPDGVALVHAIGRGDGPGFTNPWLARYIFPGGYSPALSEVFGPVERSGLMATDLEILRLHYAETLRHWRARFEARRAEIVALTDARFARMFELYLGGCELTFRLTGHMVWQMQLARPRAPVPITRDYMAAMAPARVPAPC
jgi:cyclopropane-fatty-acyl-phospholipid synthase